MGENLSHGCRGPEVLTELQLDGRLTVTELAARVKLSISPCHRRLRDLEREGAIRGYRAVVNQAAVGLDFEALVFVTLGWEDRDTVSAFRGGRGRRPARDPGPASVRRARLPSARRHRRPVRLPADAADQRLATLPGVQRLTSTLVMKHVVDDRPLPE